MFNNKVYHQAWGWKNSFFFCATHRPEPMSQVMKMTYSYVSHRNMGLSPSDPPYYAVWVGFLLLSAFSLQSETRYCGIFFIVFTSPPRGCWTTSYSKSQSCLWHYSQFSISSHWPFITVCPVLLNKLSIFFLSLQKESNFTSWTSTLCFIDVTEPLTIEIYIANHNLSFLQY